MHVTTGRAKGRTIKSVPGDLTRPVTDRVKQAVFNIIADDVIGSLWLDMFAGTGAIGIEALSRGARGVTFIDQEQRAIETIKANLVTTHLTQNARVIRQDAFHYINAFPNSSYDFIYIAPPQYKGLWIDALLALDRQSKWLAPGGAIIVQLDPHEYHDVALLALELLDQRRYGSTMLCFYEHIST